VVEHLPSKHVTPSSNPSTNKQTKIIIKSKQLLSPDQEQHLQHRAEGAKALQVLTFFMSVLNFAKPQMNEACQPQAGERPAGRLTGSGDGGRCTLVWGGDRAAEMVLEPGKFWVQVPAPHSLPRLNSRLIYSVDDEALTEAMGTKWKHENSTCTQWKPQPQGPLSWGQTGRRQP
jgi:hypothetical protein